MIASRRPDEQTVAIIGGGLAGLSAGCALADMGFRVVLHERRPFVGGRASSYELPGTGEVVDNCQHVLLGCCTNLIDFYRRTGTVDQIRWYRSLMFIEPGGRQSVIRPSWMPAPLHSSLAFLRARSLGTRDKLAIARAMLALIPRLPSDSDQSFAQWLAVMRQPSRAVERFWKPVLVSAINEDLDRISVRYGAQVFRESFLKSEAAGRMGVPSVPLTELYDAARAYITERGGEVRLRSTVARIDSAADQIMVRLSEDLQGREERADYVVMAVPYSAAVRLLPAQDSATDPNAAQALAAKLARFESSPITGIHLWFDQRVTDLDHAVLLDRTIQWMFNKTRLISRRAGPAASDPAGGAGSYLELVVSASRSLVERSRQEIIELGVSELGDFFPAVRGAKLIKAAVIKEVHATYSALPGSDAYRPAARTPWPRLFLAGDWTATGWPATMEGAVRSGYNAAEAVAEAAGSPQGIRVPDLPAAGFMRWFKG